MDTVATTTTRARAGQPLRGYQERAVSECRAAFSAGSRGVCLVLPTQAGKTRVAAEMAEIATSKGRTCGWLTHRIELSEQSKKRVPWADVRLVQALLASGERPDWSLVFIDECHRVGAGAEQWHALAQHYRDVPKVGLTATPERGDGTGLASVFDALVVGAHYSELIRDGYLVPATVWGAAPLRDSEMAEPIAPWLEHAAGLRTICFARSVEHAAELASRWRQAGVRAAHVSGEQDADVRHDAIDAFRAGELDVLTCCQILTEGFSVPDVRCIVLARGFSHVGSYLQAVGRSLGSAPGKREAVVLDLTGAWRDHGMPDQDRQYSLEGRPIRHALADDEVPPRMCRVCGWILPAQRYLDAASLCPRCGATVTRKPTQREREIRLQRVDAAVARMATDEQRLFWASLPGHWSRGRKVMKYHDKFGRWPSKAVMGAKNAA